MKLGSARRPDPLLSLFGKIAIPTWNFSNNIGFTVRNTLARQSRFHRIAGSGIEHVIFKIFGVIASLAALLHMHVTRGACAHAPTGVINLNAIMECNVEKTPRQTRVTVRNLGWIDFDLHIHWHEFYFEFFFRRLQVGILDVRIGSAHKFS
jgi:hypothetical protein